MNRNAETGYPEGQKKMVGKFITGTRWEGEKVTLGVLQAFITEAQGFLETEVKVTVTDDQRDGRWITLSVEREIVGEVRT